MEILRYPNVANSMGLPLLEGVVTTNSTNTIITFKQYAFGNDWTGGFWAKIPTEITTSSLPVVFATDGVSGNQPLLDFAGSPVLTSDIVTAGNGVMLCFYDSASNRLQRIA
ncbi:MAG: hypothetical protein MJZ30_06075 [Paludibacteraceae bacterium]|nr:hypothetical protein [Paludibacteraceae bacterium]